VLSCFYWVLKAVKASHTCYQELGLELIPVYRQSAHRLYVIHLAVGCHYFLPGLRLPSQLQSITTPYLVPGYTAWWQRHIGVNNLPKVVTQLLPRLGFEPTTCRLQVQRSTHCATAPSIVFVDRMIPFAAYATAETPNAFQSARQPLKIATSHGIWPPLNTWFVWPTWVSLQMALWLVLLFLAQLTHAPNTQTHRPCYVRHL